MTRITLRDLREDDLPQLVSLFTDPATRQWNEGPAEGDEVGWLDRQLVDSDEFHTWAVADPDDDRLLATVSIFFIEADQARAMAGYRTVPAERGRGVASAALRAASDEAFTTLGLWRIQLFHAVANPASCGVAARAGYALEGTLRASHQYGNGVRYDEHLHARLRDDPVPTTPG